MKDPFEILECTKEMTKEEIKKKYRALAFKYHPDRNTNLSDHEKKEAENKFKEITCAYTFLEKNNFKYSPLENEFGDFTSRFGAFSANFGKIGNILNTIRNMDLDNIANHILKEVNHIQDFYNGENEALDKSQDININARVEIVDIYNNVKKEITINCVKKCKLCMGLGYNIDDKTKCKDCNGLKIRMESLTLEFYSYLKTKQLLRQGNEEPNKRPGDIYINIYPKPTDNMDFRIIDDYNIQHTIFLSDEMISINNYKNDEKESKESKVISINYKCEYLDLKTYNFTITNIINQFMYEYKVENLGLLRPDNKRGSLLLQIIDRKGILENLYKKENIDKQVSPANYTTEFTVV